MDSYVLWVKANPMVAAAVQFGILGTLGELISNYVKSKRWTLNCSFIQGILKVLAWALLGVIIKYGFIGMKGFVAALFQHELLPAILNKGAGLAFVISVCTNTFFGPQMMFFHRIEENIIMGRKDYSGLDKAFWTLLWFWVPAHTVTFSLPKDYQIGLAAAWSVVLGLILGLSAPKAQSEQTK